MKAPSFPLYSIGHFINDPKSLTKLEIIDFDTVEDFDVHALHRHNFYEIIWIDHGTARQMIDHNEYITAAGSLLFISPGQLHYFEEWQQIKGGAILFTEDFFLLNYQNKDQLFEISCLDNFYCNPMLQLNIQDYTLIKHTIQLLLKEKKQLNCSANILQSLLHILLSQMQRCITIETKKIVDKKSVALYKKFKLLIDIHFRESLLASDYASKLHISQHHLNHISKQITGKTATALIRSRSILEAKRMLAFMDYTISEIAAQLNFFDASYFSKIFKASTGISPGTFQKNISEKYLIN